MTEITKKEILNNLNYHVFSEKDNELILETLDFDSFLFLLDFIRSIKEEEKEAIKSEFLSFKERGIRSYYKLNFDDDIYKKESIVRFEVNLLGQILTIHEVDSNRNPNSSFELYNYKFPSIIKEKIKNLNNIEKIKYIMKHNCFDYLEELYKDENFNLNGISKDVAFNILMNALDNKKILKLLLKDKNINPTIDSNYILHFCMITKDGFESEDQKDIVDILLNNKEIKENFDLKNKLLLMVRYIKHKFDIFKLNILYDIKNIKMQLNSK